MKSATWILPGSPDRLCDLAAAAVALEYAKADPESVTDISVMGGRGALFVSGEVISKADINAVQVIKQLLVQYGIYGELEIFADIEAVGSERVSRARLQVQEVAMVMGYASRETADYLPGQVAAAIKLAKALEQKRLNDQDWFWLTGAGRVEVNEKIWSINIGHGQAELDSVKDAISGLIEELGYGNNRLRLNAGGVVERNGLEQAIGKSGRGLKIYGNNLPVLDNASGRQMSAVENLGNLLARKAALSILGNSSAKAVMVRAWYEAGEVEPYVLEAMDEKGGDLKGKVDGSLFKLDIDHGFKEEDVSEWLKWGAMGDIHFA